MKKSIVFLLQALMLLTAASVSIAQNRSVNLNLGLQIVQPMGEFSKEYSGVPVGVAGSLSLPVRRSPVEFGFGFAWNSMGSDDHDIIALINQDATGDQFAKGRLTIRNTSSRYIVHARFRPLNGKVQPYADLFTGLEVFKTKSDISIDDISDNAALFENRDHMDMTFFIGWAAGVRVRVASAVFIEGRFESINGSKASYVDRESVEVNNDNSIDFELRESLTNRFVYQLGVAFGF